MISGVIISIAIVTLIILYFCTDTFKSPEELFWTFAKQNNKILSIICNENAKVQKGIKEIIMFQMEILTLLLKKMKK